MPTFKTKPITTILFDLDGTLINLTSPRVEANSQLIELLAKHYPQSHIKDIYYQYEECKNSVRQVWFSSLLQKLDSGASTESQAELVQELEDLYYQAFGKGCLAYRDALYFLDKIQYTVQLGVLTDTDFKSSVVKLQTDNLNRYFPEESVITFDQAKANKPDPQFFWYALEKLKCQKETTLYIGDIPKKDIKGAKAAGLITVWLRRDQHFHDPITEDMQADLEIESYYELLSELGL